MLTGNDPNEKILSTFAAAWSARDIEAVMGHFGKDAVYFASVGPQPGERAEGHQEIRSLVQRMFAHDTGATTEVVNVMTTPEGGAWSWRYTMSDGSVALGCDIFKFENGMVALKDAYRKVKA